MAITQTISLDDVTMTEVRKRAEQNDRSFSAECRCLIRRGLSEKP